MGQRSSAWRLTSRKPRCCTNPTFQEPERRILVLMETSWILFWKSPTSEALYQVMGALTMKYRGGWPRLVHLSADYSRDYGTTTTCPCGLKTIYCIPYNRAVHPPLWSRGLDSVQTTGEKAACFHDATFAFDHEDNLDGQSDKQGNTRTDRAAISGRSFDQKESPMDWTPDRLPKIGYLLSTVFWSQKERAPSSPVQGYHQKKPEAEIHKDQLMDITHSREKNGTH